MLAICLARPRSTPGTGLLPPPPTWPPAAPGRWRPLDTYVRFFAGPRLLVIDELGYLNVPEEPVAALFQVITQRLKAASSLTTNLGVASWASRLEDPMVTAAMLDRLLQRAVVLGDGPSYRLRTHQARTEDLRPGGPSALHPPRPWPPPNGAARPARRRSTRTPANPARSTLRALPSHRLAAPPRPAPRDLVPATSNDEANEVRNDADTANADAEQSHQDRRPHCRQPSSWSR